MVFLYDKVLCSIVVLLLAMYVEIEMTSVVHRRYLCPESMSRVGLISATDTGTGTPYLSAANRSSSVAQN